MDSYKRSTGANWGGYLGSKAGEFLGGAGQKLFSRITGFGDYNVKSNVFLGGNLPQVVNNTGGGGTTIRFQEYLGDIITGPIGDFKISTYNLNPADSQTFPWLSQIAANYEQFEFEGVVFQFRSTSANALNSTNTALGSVMMCTQYNVLDDIFSSKGEMLNYEFSTSGKPADSNLHMIECARSVTPVDILYTLTGLIPTGADPRLYSLGKFSIATTGFQAADVNIGELHITYQVRLIKPKLEVALGGVVDSFSMLKGSSIPGAYTNLQPLGLSTIVPIIKDTMGVTITPTDISFLRSAVKLSYRVTIRWFASSLANPVFPFLTAFNGTITDNYGLPIVMTSRAEQSFVFTTDGKNNIPRVALGSNAILPPSTAWSDFVRVTIDQLNPDVL